MTTVKAAHTTQKNCRQLIAFQSFERNNKDCSSTTYRLARSSLAVPNSMWNNAVSKQPILTRSLTRTRLRPSLLLSAAAPPSSLVYARHNTLSTTTSTSSSSSSETTHFGFANVPRHEKEGKVREVFANVADSYDVMNDFMSGGLHRYWKDYLVERTAVSSIVSLLLQQQQQQQQQQQTQQQQQPHEAEASKLKILDVAGGTGDISFRFMDAAMTAVTESQSNSSNIPIAITVCDINTEMLRVGEQRARDRYGSSHVVGRQDTNPTQEGPTTTTSTTENDNTPLRFVEGNAQQLDQFADNTYDLYTIAFGLRNVTDIDHALTEAYRVLKPGGRYMCLEFSQVPDPLLRTIYDQYSFTVIPELGHYVAQDRASYQYLVESIRKFSTQDELLHRMQRAGFSSHHTRYTNLTGGIVAIHEGWKL